MARIRRIDVRPYLSDHLLQIPTFMPASGSIDPLLAMQTVLEPQGPIATAIAETAWVLFVGAVAIFVLVLGLAAWAMLAPPARRAWLASKGFIIVASIVVPVWVLGLLLVYSFGYWDRTATAASELKIEVVGQQWWWRISYLAPAGGLDFETANELRIPVGQPVELLLRSGDVLHSFWVPNLAGKLDMVPGRVNRLKLQADRAGLFRGQCAEYCGSAHALMGLYVVAEDPAAFNAWRARQREPASTSEPLFMTRCAACHTVRGTAAGGTLGPDLTHIASRVALGAGILPNRPETLARWITSPQHLKPGSLMPATEGLDASGLHSLVIYLGKLE